MEIRRLARGDARAAFRSGDAKLDEFFHRFAGQNQFRHHIGVSYVAAEGTVLLGYVTVSAAQLDPTTTIAKGMARYPLPALRIARLAVSEAWRGRQVGSALLGFSVGLAFKMRDEYGCVGLIADAKPGAVGFYAHHDFVALSAEASETTLMFLDLGTAAR